MLEGNLSWLCAQVEVAAATYSYLTPLMPRTNRKKTVAIERELRAAAEAEAHQLRLELAKRDAQRPPLFRPTVSEQWDWSCGACGNLVYAGRRNCKCGAPRCNGATFTGSVRGVLQNTAAAREGLLRQRQVPGFAPVQRAPRGVAPTINRATEQLAAARCGYARTAELAAKATTEAKATKKDEVVGAKASFAEVARRPAPVQQSRTQQAAAAPAAELAPQGPPRSADIPASSAAQLFAEDDEAQNEQEVDDLEENPTIPEELGYEAVRAKLRKFERLLHKRKVRHVKQLEEVAAQEAYIAEQKATLLELQSVADATNSQMQEYAATVTQLSSRAAEMAAERERALESNPQGVAQAATDQQVQQDGVAYAQKLAGDLLAGMHNFNNENPAVQTVLQQLMAAIESVRQAHTGGQVVPDPRQPTLPNFLRQHANSSTGPTSLVTGSQAPAAAVKNFDISDPTPEEGQHAAETPTAGTTSDPMQVTGECPGEKRKSECLQSSSPADGASDADITGDEAPEGVAKRQVQALGTPMEPLRFSSEEYVPKARSDLLASLDLRNKEQARERKARTEAQHQKICPY